MFERLPSKVLPAAVDDTAWAGLRKLYGPETLRQACQEAIGELVDEHRLAMATLAGRELLSWLARHRWRRSAVEMRLAGLELELAAAMELVRPRRSVVAPAAGAPVPVLDARQVLGLEEVWVWIHRFLDAAADGLTMEETQQRFGVRRPRLIALFHRARVPLPWRSGGRPSRSSPAVLQAAQVLRERMAEAGGGMMPSPPASC